MIIPASTLSRLVSKGILGVPKAVEVGYEEGYVNGENSSICFLSSVLDREVVIVSMFPKDEVNLDCSDDYIRGYRQAIENVKNKVKIKYKI